MASVLNDFGVSGVFPSKVGGTGTGAKYFPRLLGSAINVAPLTPSATNATGMLAVPGLNTMNGQLFTVNATGSFGNDTGDPSGTVQIQLYAVTANATTGSYTVNPVYTALSGTGALTPSTFGIVNTWSIKTTLYGSTDSGIVGGNFVAFQNGATVNSSPKNTLTTLSGINFNGVIPAGLSSATGGVGTAGGNAPFGLVVGVVFGTSDASNTASLYQFNLEA